MDLFLTFLYDLPFLLAAHFCIAAGLLVDRSKGTADSVLSGPNSNLLRSFLVCTGVVNLIICVVHFVGWLMEIKFAFQADVLPWIFSITNWCLVWHSYRLWNKFTYKAPGSNYKVPLSGDPDTSSRASDGVPVGIRRVSATTPTPKRQPKRDTKGRFAKKDQ